MKHHVVQLCSHLHASGAATTHHKRQQAGTLLLRHLQQVCSRRETSARHEAADVLSALCVRVLYKSALMHC